MRGAGYARFAFAGWSVPLLAACTPSAPPLPAPTLSGKPFKVVMKVLVGEKAAKGELAFFGKHAVEYQEGLDSPPEAIYDLEEMSWRNMESRKTVHYQDCLSWSRRREESLRKSLAGTDDSASKRLIEQSLEPRFRVEPVEGGLLFSSEGMTYRVRSTQTFQEGQQVRFFSFEKLNAYRKAMENQGPLPSLQLALDRELEARSMVPNQMEVTLKTPGGEVKLSTQLSLEEMSPEEQDRVASALR